MFISANLTFQNHDIVHCFSILITYVVKSNQTTEKKRTISKVSHIQNTGPTKLILNRTLLQLFLYLQNLSHFEIALILHLFYKEN